MQNITSEKGFTLIEILLSISLLSIVLIGFLSIFPQMGKLNTFNETKAEAINVAKEVLINWQEATEVKAFIVKNDHVTGFTPILGSKVTYTNFSSVKFTDYYYFETTKDQYDVRIKIKKVPHKTSNTAQVNQIIVQLLNERGNVVSETYGYVKRIGVTASAAG